MNNLVLVVDDEADFREILQTKLTASGYRVETASTGKEGIAKAKAIRPDLILMDIDMPVMDGREAALLLYDDPQTTDLKIAFLTNFSNSVTDLHNTEHQFVRRFGVMEYIKKTDDLATIAKKVKALLEQGNTTTPVDK